MDPDPYQSSLAFVGVLLAPLSAYTFGLALFIFVSLLVVSAFVSGSEVALFSLEARDREALAEQDDTASRYVLSLLARPQRLLVTILILNNFVNVAAAVLAALMMGDLAEFYGWNETLVFFIEVVALTFMLLILSEITPKLTAVNHPISYSRIAARPLVFFTKVLAPFAGLLTFMIHRIKHRLPEPTPLSTDDLKAMAEVGEAHGTLEEEEREWIHSIVDLNETAVREIMCSRLDVSAIAEDTTLEEALELIRTSSKSRLPLYEEHLDNIKGMIYAKDLIPLLGQNGEAGPVDWIELARPALFVPLGKKLDDLLRDFQARRTHIAIVVDEYGGTAGLVTLEDVLEEIIGEIQDEHDATETALYKQLTDTTFRFDARVDLDDLNEVLVDRLGTDRYEPFDTNDFDFETLGGLIFHVTESIPHAGQQIRYGPLNITVESIENHRIHNVLVAFAP